MNEETTEYKFYIRADRDNLLDSVAQEVTEATWRAGHCAHLYHRRVAAPEAAQLNDDTRQTDVFVSLCRNPSETIRRECAVAVADGKAVLAIVVGDEAEPADLEALERLLDGNSEVSLLVGLATTIPEVAVTEYVIAMHKLVRRLDRTRMLLDAGGNPYSSNRFVRKFASMGRILSRRCNENPFLKKGIADFFYQNNIPHLIQHGVRRMFLESGSSIAYIAEALAEGLHEEWILSKPYLEIETNNILAYLELASARKVRVSLNPPGRPDDKYGATLGSLMWVEPDRGGPIEGEARREVVKLKDSFKATYQENGLLIGATSGIDLDGETPGFHTGTFSMMLFKRAMLEAAMEAGIPLIIVADEHKIPNVFNATKCFSICDPDLPWGDVCREVPLAIACAFRTQARGEQVLSRLIQLGFSAGQQESDGQVPWSVVVGNERFLSASKGWFRAQRLTAPSRPDVSMRPRLRQH